MKRTRTLSRPVLVAVGLLVLGLETFSAQSDSRAKLGTVLGLIQQRYETDWKRHAAGELRRVDASLGMLESLIQIDLDSREPVLPVAVVVRDEGLELLRAGFVIQSRIGDVVATRVPASRLGELSALASVVSVEPSVLQRPLAFHDVSVPETRATLARQSFGVGGKNVVVGIIDSGIDWRHNDFRRSDGKTRIKFLWDMSDARGPEPSDIRGGGGTVYTEAQINAALDGSGSVQEADRNGHGSHVGGSAAGNGRATGNGFPAGTFTGMAPDADLVIVKGFRSDQTASFASNDQIMALDYIDRRARELGKPYVINMSLGGHSGPHDGSSANERAIDALVGPGIAGKVVVIAAGNEGADDIHASGTVPGGGATETVRFSVPANRTSATIDLWYEGSDSFTLSVTTPTSLSTDFVAPGGTFTGNTSDGTTVEIASTTTRTLNNAKNIGIFISNSVSGRAVLSGTWSFRLRRTSGSSGRFDAWALGRTRFVDHIDTSGRVGMPGTARNAITVGSYVTKNRWTDIDGIARDYRGWGPVFDAPLLDRSPFSGQGPTRDGRQKPEISAPGQGIGSVNSADSEQEREMTLPDGQHKIEQGTSMATPHVTGAVALILEAKPTLDAIQVRDTLTRTARSDDFTRRVPNSDFGFGKMDVYEAVRDAKGSSGTKPPTPDPVITSVEPDSIVRGTTVQVAVNGSNFTGTLAVEVTPSAGITVNQASIVSAAKVNANLTVAASAAVATYKIVILADGRRSNPGTFRVVDENAPSKDPDDAYEPNEVFSSAKALPGNGQITARIFPRNDVDVFKFSATQGRRVIFDLDANTLTPRSNLDSVIAVFDKNGNLLDYADDDGVTLDSYLEWVPRTTGTYYLYIAAYPDDEGGPSTTGKYLMKVSGYAGDIRSDSTAPIMVRTDVATPDFLNKTTEMFGSWHAEDPESGIDHYEYGIGSGPGASDIVKFTRTTNNSIYLSGLKLQDGGTYYLSVRAFNAANLGSPLVTSNPVRIDTTRRMYSTYFPRVVALNDTFTGFALTNTGSFLAQAIFRLYDNNGNLVLGEGVTNPFSLSLRRGEQLPILTTELFDLSSADTPGWVEVESTSDAIRGFYLYGSSSSLDGADVTSVPQTDFVFQRVIDAGEGAFTSLSVVNPNLVDATARFELRDSSGTLTGTATVTVGARKRVVKLIRDLFPAVTRQVGGTIRVVSDQGLVGFELFANDTSDLGGLNPQKTTDTAQTLYFAHLVARGGWFTEISVTNPNTFPIDVELRALRDSGDILPAPGNPRTVRIPAGGQYNGDAGAIFQFAGTAFVQGYVTAKVVSASGGIFGHVTFGTTNGAELAALPVQTAGSRSMVFSQIAQGFGYFTGITLVNPSTTIANVKTEVFDADGISLGALTETFRPGEKKARVITQIVSGADGLLAGYVVVTSDVPLIGFELFGDASLDQAFLAAVPPQLFGAGTAAPAGAVGAGVSRRQGARPRTIPGVEQGSLSSKVARALGNTGTRRSIRPDLR